MISFSAVMRATALTTLTAAGVTFSASSYALVPFEATYQFSYGNKNVGNATRKLTQQGNQWQYQFSSRIPVLGSATETSKFSFKNGQIQSQSYLRQTKILLRSDTVTMNFKPQQKTISTSRKGTQRTLVWQNGVLDDLNAELQVREDLKRWFKIQIYYCRL
ncbi:hypothetical protein GWI33_009924 [Rhynchophorus ferrugineus]|uniref:DUF3108 domain-containing protein n=1 Tax=Rhynchophorus ferrugineus TaxID=354439 RepID=A0A834ICR1_RHYFE|nr:hypothetical protein GWI33_009924 [Rhynchophorus ferrugineus]